ncbi:hypothetical protein B4N89_46170 [Embleya scabrispora]|uniref:N-acetyltransferase domain-containing protein n=2 Tax=Embleya scabrispora TaxID=159449 RepID=A0A1T3NJR8_9ACTN|nr:hypothetical protein B4N89_46170 [Embleya scabrispora]
MRPLNRTSHHRGLHRMRGFSFTMRKAHPTDVNQFMTLIALADPDHPDPYGEAREFVLTRHGAPLEGEGLLALVAVDETGKLVGALLAGIPKWVFTHVGIPTQFEIPLSRRVANVHGVAVHPEYRYKGVGRSLIRQAEEEFKAAGWRVMTLEHPAHLDDYYARLGYTNHNAIVVNLPSSLISVRIDDTRVSARSLHPRARLASVFGIPGPVINGLLPGTDMPENAWFDGRRLRS